MSGADARPLDDSCGKQSGSERLISPEGAKIELPSTSRARALFPDPSRNCEGPQGSRCGHGHEVSQSKLEATALHARHRRNAARSPASQHSTQRRAYSADAEQHGGEDRLDGSHGFPNNGLREFVVDWLKEIGLVVTKSKSNASVKELTTNSAKSASWRGWRPSGLLAAWARSCSSPHRSRAPTPCLC
eukprot:6186724-Pleurochrysis_carterae.AAC.1